VAFLEAYQALGAATPDPAALPTAQMALLHQWMAQNPTELFDELREREPIFVAPGATVLTRYDDVVEALAHDEVFSVKLYAPLLEAIAGHFVVGMEDTPEYERYTAVLRLVFSRYDLDRVRQASADLTRELLAAARPRGRIDTVQGLARLVPLRFIADYFGVPGPDEATMMRWTRAIFHEIFDNLAGDPTVRDAGVASGHEMGAYLDQLIASRHAARVAGNSGKDDIVGRLLRLQMDPVTALDDATIRNLLIGLTTAMVDNVTTAITHVIDELLRRPAEMAAARTAALANDDDLLTHYIYEAWRFNPQNVLLVRHCELPYVIARGTERATPIQPGTAIYAMLISAMFDPHAIDTPDEFRIGRSLAYDYLHWGSGLHMCLGRYISTVQMSEVIKQLLSLPGLRRATGAEGVAQMDGAFAQQLVVEFDAGGTHG